MADAVEPVDLLPEDGGLNRVVGRMEIQGLDRALREGARMHVFRSGGGLRVVRLERDKVLVGYGEHPHLGPALEHASEDFLAGHRPYGEVYGGKHERYLTGAEDPAGSADLWVLRGRNIDAWYADGECIVEAQASVDVSPFHNLSDLRPGYYVNDQGVVYEVREGSWGLVGQPVCTPPGMSSKFRDFAIRGVGATFGDAFDALFGGGEPQVDVMWRWFGELDAAMVASKQAMEMAIEAFPG